jgi:DNA-binding HxlR family transcriptional regulator
VHRSYGDQCGVARSLDVVGERWALLIVRELLFGPKRYNSLQAGLRGASTNVLSQRLRELEEAGVVVHRKLGPPASSWVYELTEWGRMLEPVLIHLGRWGLLSPFRDPDAEASVDSLMLALRTHFEPGTGARVDDTYTLRIGDDAFSIRVAEAGLDVSRESTSRPDALIETDAATFTTLITGARSPQEAVAAGLLTIEGDQDAAQRLFRATMTPAPVRPAPVS